MIPASDEEEGPPAPHPGPDRPVTSAVMLMRTARVSRAS